MAKLKLWELDKSKRYVDQDGDVLEWRVCDWYFNDHKLATEFTWATIETMLFTEHEPLPEKNEKKLYAYLVFNEGTDDTAQVVYFRKTKPKIPCGFGFQRMPEYDLTFEDK